MSVTRTKAREQAFLVLFAISFREENIEEIMDAVIENGDIKDDEFTRELIVGTNGEMPFIDDMVKKYLKDWDIKRISKAALAALRIAVYEMMSATSPVSVAINEAVELCKKYGADTDAAFVNGVLSSIAKSDVPAEESTAVGEDKPE